MDEIKEETPLFKAPIILFDNDCILCKRFKESLEKIPEIHEYSFIPIQNDNIFSAFPHLNKEECFETLHLIDFEGKVYQGGKAVSHLIEKFPMVAKFAWLVEKDVGKKTVDFFYNAVNKYRKALKRKCPKCNKEKAF